MAEKIKTEKKVSEVKKEKAKPEAKGGAKSRMEKAATLKNISALTKDSLDVLKFVLMTERAVQLIETQNKLVFVVDRRANKPEIKKAAEDVFNAKVSGVKTMVDQEGRKKAFVKFEKAGEAGEIAIRLGII